MLLWRALLLPAAAQPTPSAGTPVYASLRPLVGGPAFLPLHVQIEHEGLTYDFLPVDATSMETTRALLSGGAVAGRIRCRNKESVPSRRRLVGFTTRDSEQLRTFAVAQDESLSLTLNNWCAEASCQSPRRATPTHARPENVCTRVQRGRARSQLDLCSERGALCHRLSVAFEDDEAAMCGAAAHV
jgi:hypothetical protein